MIVKKTSDGVTPSLDKVMKGLRQVAPSAYNFWNKTTPVKTGNARNKTKLSRDTITANYSYASRLDGGSSKQAPKGMSGPTTEFITRLIKQIIRK
jgi:hypothetical protein